MSITDITPGLDQLAVDLDQLESSLGPLLGDMSTVSSKLPLLDKAKLYVLVSYSLESLLFSSLRLNGVETKNHAIFTELTRVRQYFDKIKKIETPAPQREATVDTQAAIRFLRSDLADDKAVRDKLSEQLAKERAKAELKAAKKSGKKRSSDEEGSPAPAGSETPQGKQGTSEHIAKRPKHDGSKRK